MTTKVHAMVDALGNPAGFYLLPGQAHDFEGADILLKDTPCVRLHVASKKLFLEAQAPMKTSYSDAFVEQAIVQAAFPWSAHD